MFTESIIHILKYKLAIVFVFLFIFSCKEKEEPKKVNETGTMTDVEGNVYKTVKIGNQWWMAENLKVKKFRNNTAIPQRQVTNDWINNSAAYCVYQNNSDAPGLLYNFYVITDTNKIAPIGWHIPSDDEWKTLELELGMSPSDANKVNWRGLEEAEKLKVESPTGWTAYNDVWSTNESGFSALAGSCRLFNGTWGDPGLNSTGFWWSSTAHSNGAWYRYLDYKNKNIFRYYAASNYGMSIRCVKD